MNGFFAQIRAIVAQVLSSIRFSWVRCRETGEMVLQRVAGTVDGLFPPGAAPVIEPQADLGKELAPNPAAPDKTVDLIKKAATELAGGVENNETLNALPDRVLQWLSALDRVMLCRLMVATPAQIRAHLDGKSGGLQKVIACEKEAIAMYVEARRRRARQDEDFEREMTEDCAPLWAA